MNMLYEGLKEKGALDDRSELALSSRSAPAGSWAPRRSCSSNRVR